jgi:hypothetical protein
MMLICCCNVSRADDDLESICKPIEHSIGNCSCAITFLKQTVGDDDAQLLIRNWAISVDTKGDGRQAFEEFYHRYDSERQLQAAWSFLKVHVQFEAKCLPLDADLWDLD